MTRTRLPASIPPRTSPVDAPTRQPATRPAGGDTRGPRAEGMAPWPGRRAAVIRCQPPRAGQVAAALIRDRAATTTPGQRQADARAAPGQAADPRVSVGRRLLRGDRGAGAAEIVIAVPLLMLLILLVVQFAVWAHAMSVAQATAEEALAAARVQGGSAAAGQQRAGQVLGQIGSAVLVGPQVSVTRTAGTATVRIHATAEQVMPLPGLNLPVTITVTGPVERFVPSTGG